MRRVLIVDGDALFAETLAYLLQQVGYETVVVGSGEAALAGFADADPDIVLLELELPDGHGERVCRQLHADTRVPIVIVTARDTEADKINGLDCGADDFVTKPLSGRELIARMSAVLRRHELTGSERSESVLTLGPVQVDVERHRVLVRGVEVELRLKDFTVLTYLLRNSGQLVGKRRLIEQVWGEHFDGDPKRVDAIIARLRAKIEVDPAQPRHLLTVRGLGYRIDA